MIFYMTCHDKLGTEYCPNCAIINEKIIQLEIRENIISRREKELDDEVTYMRISVKNLV